MLAAALLGGCYSPTANAGAPCSAEGACPTGQECRSGWCFAQGAPHDAEQAFDEAVTPEDADLDGPGLDASAYVPWGTPTELTSLETTGGNETDPSLTSDRMTAVLTATTAPGDRDIWIATRTALTDTFTPMLLTDVSATDVDDDAPEISADGKTLYFVSNRGGSAEIYISVYTTAWSTPIIATDLSSAGGVDDLAISPDGLTAAVVRSGSQHHVYISTRATTADPYGNATLHAELEVTTDIAAPTITNGGAIIYLHAGSSRDIYRAQLKGDGTYTTPAPVTELNTMAARDAAPFVVQTDDYLVYEKSGDIFETSRMLP